MTEAPVAAWDDEYASLCDDARRTAAEILRQGKGSTSNASARYLFEESTRLADAYTDDHRASLGNAAAEALDVVARMWPAIHRGAMSGEELFARCGDLWPRLMDEWPMGHYAEMAATALSTVDSSLDLVVELGAGVGATTRRIRQTVADRGGRVFATDLQYRGVRMVDFDRPLLPQLPRLARADVVVATNALHCAHDAEATLRWIREAMLPSGVLVMAEGAPFPQPNVPWALNLLFGVCRGWYDRGGFRPPQFWLDATRDAGFVDVVRTPWPSDRYELGGCLVARVAP